VEWYEAILEDEGEALSAEDALALRTMKALEDTEIRIALSRISRQGQPMNADTRLAFRFPALQVRHA
jgi:hypothetical protein